ncbi:MAG TPA: BTAD domain-containing putative transcriptional regulator [Ktedonobacteraceae bacterium]
MQKLREVILGAPSEPGRTHSFLPAYKLVLLCAPAGYGKTTLLADFVRQTSLPCCWYFLDITDAEEAIFLKTLILSIVHTFPQLKSNLNPLLAGRLSIDGFHAMPGSHFADVIDALIPILTTGIDERFGIFLCNYHTINHSKKINALVNQLLRNLPPQCLLLIESRAVPDLDFAHLLAHDEIIGLDHHFLSFTTDDIINLALLQGMPPLKKEEAAQLNTLFDGWIGGILLGTRLGDLRTLRAGKDLYHPVSMPAMPIDRQKIFAYLVNEVFSQRPEVYSFLKAVAVLQQLTPALCNALLECTDAAARLQYLEQQGLFVMRNHDDSQIVYVCHPILRELLGDELRRQSPEQFANLHRRAMDLWLNAGDTEQAIYHALEAHLYEEAARLIESISENTLAQGRGEMLSNWLKTLPTEILEVYPRLFLTRANLHLLLGEYLLALPWLTKASETVHQHPELLSGEELDLFQTRLSIAHSKALYQMGDYHQAQQLCQNVIERIPADEVDLCAEAHMHLGICANLLGVFSEGIAHLQKALQLWGRESCRRQVAELHTALAGTYRLIGNFALAEHHLARATQCWDALQNDWGKLDNLIHAGQIKHQQGEFGEAESLLLEALAIARGRVHFPRGEAYALVSLGALYQDQEAYRQSLTFTEEGLALARRLKDRYLINSTLCILAMTYLFMDDKDTALLLLSESQPDLADGPQQNGTYEKAKRDLALGTILLCKGQYEQAYEHLAEAEKQIRSSYLQEDRLHATLRLMECQIKQGQFPQIMHRLDALTKMIQMNDYEQLLMRELRLLPELKQLIQTRPELEDFRKMLHIEVLTTLPQVTPPVAAPVPAKPQTPLASSPPVIEIVRARTPRLKIQALGEPAIFINDAAITRWRTKRAMELFFLLLNSDAPLRKGQIITALWAETTEHIDSALHSTIYRLRKLLGEACIASRIGVYWLDLAATYGQGVWYDVTTFQSHAAQARRALEEKNDEEAQNAFLAMVDLYHGDYLQSFYSDWCSFQRDRLRLAYLDARQHLAHIAWRQEQFDESVLQWQHVLAVDDCLEEAHYGLMRCYLRQGKRGLAWRQYQRCAERLESELGAKPGPAIQNLLQHLGRSSSA